MTSQDHEDGIFTEAMGPGDDSRPLCDTGSAGAERKPPQSGRYLQMASSAQLMARNARSVHQSIASFQESVFYSCLPLVSFLYIIGAAAVIPRVCNGQ
jgi:hypothetical protein